MVRKPMRATLYLHVSRDGQTTENQRLTLKAAASQRGWTIANVFEDNGISGAEGRDQRPSLDALMKDASKARFDVEMAWALDRLGRSPRDLLDTLEGLEAANVDLFLHQQAIDTTTSAGRMFFDILGAFSEFERDMIRSPVNAGQSGLPLAGYRCSVQPYRSCNSNGGGWLKTNAAAMMSSVRLVMAFNEWPTHYGLRSARAARVPKNVASAKLRIPGGPSRWYVDRPPLSSRR